MAARYAVSPVQYIHTEDCESCCLSSDSSSLVKHQWLKPGTLGSTPDFHLAFVSRWSLHCASNLKLKQQEEGKASAQHMSKTTIGYTSLVKFGVLSESGKAIAALFG